MKIFTIGFTKKSASTFFRLLKQPGLTKLIDTRLNNISQLAGFAKRDDLAYFAMELCGISYLHLPELAPSQIMLDAYKKEKGEWSLYEDEFNLLLKTRRVELQFGPETFDGSCLLCSEATPEHCHRRLVAEYLRAHWPDMEIIHL